MAREGLKRTYTAPAVEKAFEIITLLGEHPEGLLVSEMATHLGRSVGELFRIVVVMEQSGYLAKSSRTDRYAVTYRLLDAAFRATPAQDLVSAALSEMQALARTAHQSCHLVVLNENTGMVIASVQQPGPRGFSVRVGGAVDVIGSCSGQLLLAFAGEDRTNEILADAEKQGLLTDRPSLEHRLTVIRAHGYDTRPSPITRGVTDISFPVHGFDGHVAAALTIPFLELIDGSQKVDLGAAREMLRATVERVSDALGYRREPAL